MKRVSFFIPLKPFSINKTYCRDRRHKTQDFRDWELACVQALRAPAIQKKLEDIRSAPATKGYLVRLDFKFPRAVLYNKAGEISSRAEDLTNIEKPLIDILFLPKYHVQFPPYGCPNVNADDKHILRMTSTKSVSADDRHWIKIAIVALG